MAKSMSTAGARQRLAAGESVLLDTLVLKRPEPQMPAWLVLAILAGVGLLVTGVGYVYRSFTLSQLWQMVSASWVYIGAAVAAAFVLYLLRSSFVVCHATEVYVVVTTHRVLKISRGFDVNSELTVVTVESVPLSAVTRVVLTAKWGWGIHRFAIRLYGRESALFSLSGTSNVWVRLLIGYERWLVPAGDVWEMGGEILEEIAGSRERLRLRVPNSTQTRAPESPLDPEAKRRRLALLAEIRQSNLEQDWHRILELVRNYEESFGVNSEVLEASTRAKVKLRIRELRSQLDQAKEAEDIASVIGACDAILEHDPELADVVAIRRQYQRRKYRHDAITAARDCIESDELTQAHEVLTGYVQQYPDDEEASNSLQKLESMIGKRVGEVSSQLRVLLEGNRPTEAVAFARSQPDWVAEHNETAHLVRGTQVLDLGLELLHQSRTAAALGRLRQAQSLLEDVNREHLDTWVRESEKALARRRRRVQMGIGAAGVVLMILTGGMAYYCYSALHLELFNYALGAFWICCAIPLASVPAGVLVRRARVDGIPATADPAKVPTVTMRS